MSHTPSDPARQFAVKVVRQLREAGYQAVWAGGCVRDEILGRTPKDYDVATNALPEQVREIFGRRRTLSVGAAFGVIIVVGRREEGQVDVATFRSDVSYSDGRRPDAVRYSNDREDAARRDFTINGLFYDPVEDHLIDYVGGQEDLERGVLRAIGDPAERFAEDKLRMLRAARMASTFQLDIEPATLAAVRQHAGDITVVSGERIATEMRRMLTDPHQADSARLLHSTGLQPVILPEANVLAPPAGAPWQRTLEVLARLGKSSFPVGLAGLLRYVATGAAQETHELVRSIGARWRLSTEEIKLTTWLLVHEPLAREARAHPWHQVQPVLIAAGARDLLQLATAVAGDDPTAQANLEFCRQKIELPPELLNPKPLLSGHDLLELGLPRGPLFQTLLRDVRNEQLEGQLATKADALAWAAERWRELNID